MISYLKSCIDICLNLLNKCIHPSAIYSSAVITEQIFYPSQILLFIQLLISDKSNSSVFTHYIRTIKNLKRLHNNLNGFITKQTPLTNDYCDSG